MRACLCNETVKNRFEEMLARRLPDRGNGQIDHDPNLKGRVGAVEMGYTNNAGDRAEMLVFCSDMSADLTKKAPDTDLGGGEKPSKKPLFFSDF
jgi:hypothetical protein